MKRSRQQANHGATDPKSGKYIQQHLSRSTKQKLIRGFTMVELMVVVAVMAVLALIAIPNYLVLQLRSKRAELPINLNGIRNAEQAYNQEWDVFTSCVVSPTTVPGRSLVPFGHSFGDGSSWDLMGWIPDGEVRAQYQVDAIIATSLVQANFSAQATSDLDVNGLYAVFFGDRATHPIMVTDNSRY